MNLTLEKRTRIVDKVFRLVEIKHCDPGMNGVDWKTLVKSRRAQILACEEPEKFEKELNRLLAKACCKTPCFKFGRPTAGKFGAEA